IELLARDRLRAIPERLDAERVGEPARGIDGEDERAPPAPRGLEAERRGDRRLADAAAADADDDAPAPEERGRAGARPRRADRALGGGATGGPWGGAWGGAWGSRWRLAGPLAPAAR